MNYIKEKKNEIRAKYRQLRNSIDPSRKSIFDKAICDRFLSLASYRYSEILLAYSPIHNEIDIMPIIEDALKQGKRVALPRCNSEECTMNYHFITDTDQLVCGTMNIPEPSADLPMYDPFKESGKPAVCLVPALVFDNCGYRLGYGKGYYDRFLSDFNGTRVGAVYSDFVLERVPRGKFDLSVDVLVTEKGVKTTNAD